MEAVSDGPSLLSSAVRMTDSSKVAEVRRRTAEQTRALQWNEADSGRAALIATEMATNLLKHARDGAIVIVGDGTALHLQLIAVDRGPGIGDLERCFTDGYSTAGSPGSGLGALRRLSNHLEAYSTPERGSVFVAEVRPGAERTAAQQNGGGRHFRIGGLGVPHGGESVCGDAWDARVTANRLCMLMCDGLGHGFSAAEASRAAIAEFRSRPIDDAREAMTRIHAALRPTRGAAAAVAVVDRDAQRIGYCGIGNISGVLVNGHQMRQLVSHNGILGHSAARIAEFAYPWNEGTTLVMHSDGVSARWKPEEWPGLWVRSPAVIASVLYRDYTRGNDDASVVVASAS